ncbi:hypothetical protein EDD11_002560 [Mortierella claussenii]|nr:hypothetical protein EDD11_002560 [Mortierella claussenii]
MKFFTIVALLAAATVVSAAALPIIEPKNAVALQQEQNVPETVVTEPAPTTAKSYIVVFKQTAAAQAIEKIENDIVASGGKVGHRYDTVLKGLSAWIPASAVSALSTNPAIAYIEEDGEVVATN